MVQGMNASMNDTHNLVWKITQVLRGWSSPTLLSTVSHFRFFLNLRSCTYLCA